MEKRFSMNELLKNKFGEAEKNQKTKRSTDRATKKTSSDTGRYVVKIVNGVKYMSLK